MQANPSGRAGPSVPLCVRCFGGATRSGGFTLIELMTAIAVLAILMMVAVPSFTTLIRSNRLTSQANALIGALQYARSEAVSRNTRVLLCRSDNGQQCASGAQWSGWVVGLDSNRDGNVDAGAVLRTDTISQGVAVSNSNAIANNVITFYPDGRAHGGDGGLLSAALQACIATSQPPENLRNIWITTGSTFEVARAGSGDGSCPAAPADSP